MKKYINRDELTLLREVQLSRRSELFGKIMVNMDGDGDRPLSSVLEEYWNSELWYDDKERITNVLEDLNAEWYMFFTELDTKTINEMEI